MQRNFNFYYSFLAKRAMEESKEEADSRDPQLMGYIKVKNGGDKLAQTLESLNWPLLQPSQICQRILQNFYEESMHTDSIDESQFDEMVARHTISSPSCGQTTVYKQEVIRPRLLAQKLGVSRESIYTINREIRRQLKRGRHIHFEEPANNNTDKDVILSSIFSYCETNKHVFYTCNDVKDHLQRSTRIRKLPSTTTIARYLKNNIGLSFKKVNIRSTSLWSNSDVITKLKYSWIYHNLCSRGYMITYIDEFNISDTSIKKYSWTRRGSQNYWFGPRRLKKINWIIVVCEAKPVHIMTTNENIDSSTFWKFLTEASAKVKEEIGSDNRRHAFVFNNAPIHGANYVRNKIQSLKQLAVALPPYTPEWNPVELTIKIIKSRLDWSI